MSISSASTFGISTSAGISVSVVFTAAAYPLLSWSEVRLAYTTDCRITVSWIKLQNSHDYYEVGFRIVSLYYIAVPEWIRFAGLKSNFTGVKRHRQYLSQYAGRLHRMHDIKKADIYDYVDLDVRFCQDARSANETPLLEQAKKSKMIDLCAGQIRCYILFN